MYKSILNDFKNDEGNQRKIGGAYYELNVFKVNQMIMVLSIILVLIFIMRIRKMIKLKEKILI